MLHMQGVGIAAKQPCASGTPTVSNEMQESLTLALEGVTVLHFKQTTLFSGRRYYFHLPGYLLNKHPRKDSACTGKRYRNVKDHRELSPDGGVFQNPPLKKEFG